MDYKKEKVLNITLKDKEIENFQSIINKCKEGDKNIGFNNNKFTDDENKLLKDINNALEITP